MEGVPRLPMLSIELKTVADYTGIDWMDTPVDTSKENVSAAIAQELKKHISEKYMDDPTKYQDCIANFIELQTEAYKATRSPTFEGCNILKKYYGQLHYMQSRFPFTGDNALSVMFTWCDSFTGIYRQHDTFAFEQSSVVFNLGASHSYLGAIDNRASDEGTRVSCVHFQCAAGFFQFLGDRLDTTLAPDTSQFMLKLFTNIMLGQGQECLLEKSMQDNRKNSLVAKISQQVVDYYKATLQSLNNQEAKGNLGDSTTKYWKSLISMKISYYSAITKFYQGSSSWEQGSYGEGVAYLAAAVKAHQDAAKAAKSLKGDTRSKVDDALTYAADVIGGKHNSVKKDNEFVYHDRVRNADTLPDVKGASLVKPLPFEPTNASVTGPDIFAKLVPLEAHLAASTYSEEKAKVLRTILAEVEEKDAILEQFKHAIDLDPDKLMKLDDDDKLDSALVEHCAVLSVDQSSIDNLKKAMKGLSDCYMDIDSLLHETGQLVEVEESESREVKETCGKTVESPDAVEKLKNELKVCKDVHFKAGEMNDNLHTAVKTHIQNLKLVAEGLEAIKKYCGFEKMAHLLNDEDFEDISLVQKLCSKVKEMEEQRQSLISQLRKQLEEDDVTSSIVMKPGVDAEDLFQEELKKHDTTVGYIRQNLAAQQNILSGVTEVNVRYSKIKKVVDNHREKVATKSDQLLLSCTGYQEAIKKCQDATNFFKELLGRVSEVNEDFVALHQKNKKLRAALMGKWKAKQAPPRPSAPKPKATPAPAAPGAAGLLSAQQLQEMAGDMDEFNDPEFLAYLRMTGALTGATVPSSNPPSTGAPPGIPSTAPSMPRPALPNQAAHFTPRLPQTTAPGQQLPYAAPGPGNDPSRLLGPVEPRSQIPPHHGLSAHNQPRPASQRYAVPGGEAQAVHPPVQAVQPSATQLGGGNAAVRTEGEPQIYHYPQDSNFAHQGYGNHGGPHPVNSAQAFPGNVQNQQMPSPVRHSASERFRLQGATNHDAQIAPTQPVHPRQSNLVTPRSYPIQQPATSQYAAPSTVNAPWNMQAPRQIVQAPTPAQPHQPPMPVQHPGPHRTQSAAGQAPPRPTPPHQQTHPSAPAVAAYQRPASGVVRASGAPVTSTTFPHQTPLPAGSYNPQLQTSGQTPFAASQHSVQSLSPQNRALGSHPAAQSAIQNPGMPVQAQQTFPAPRGVPQALRGHSPYQDPGALQGIPSSQPYQGIQNPLPRAPPTSHQAPVQGHSGGVQNYQPQSQHSAETSAGYRPTGPSYNQGGVGPYPPRPQNLRPRGQQPMPQWPVVPAGNQHYRPVGPHPGAPGGTSHHLQQVPASNQNLSPPSPQRGSQPLEANVPASRTQQFHGLSQPSLSLGHLVQQRQPQNQPLSTATSQAPPTAYQPPPAASQAPPTAYQPPPATSQAPRTAYQPPPATSQAPPTAYQPPHTAYQPPLATSQAPPTAYQPPPAASQAPPTAYQPPPAASQAPPTAYQPPPATSQAPRTAYQPPPAASQAPPTAYQPPPAASKAPPTASPMMQPLVPQAVGEAAKPVRPEKPRPSEDLAGLTYTPSMVLMPQTTNSADELLSGSPEPGINVAPSTKQVLTPTIVDDSEDSLLVRQTESNPYDNDAELMQLKTDTENFQKRVASLLLKEPGNLCALDKDWKNLSEQQEKHARQLSTAVARCCSYKNRFQDILPFDQNRIALEEGKDDYVNASLIDGISPYAPKLIATQSPLPSTVADFWTMVYEQQVTLIVMLASEADVPKKCAKYWPDDRNLPHKHGPLSVLFTKSRRHDTYIERTFTLKHAMSSLQRSLTQLQYIAWPDHSKLPTSARDLLEFIRVVSSFHGQQRSLQWPVVVHCENGVSHTGTFCAACVCVQDLSAGQGVPDVLDVVHKARCKRKYMVQEKAQLKFIYDLTLLCAIDLLKQRGVVVDPRPAVTQQQMPPQVPAPAPKTTPSSTFDVFGSGSLSSIRASVDKMTVRPPDKLAPTTPASSVSTPTANSDFPSGKPLGPSPSSPSTNQGSNAPSQSSAIGPNQARCIYSQANESAKDAGLLFPNTPVMPDLLNDCTSDCNRSGTDLIATSRGSGPNLTAPDPGPPNPVAPSDQEAPQKTPVSLLDQLTPESFTLGQDTKERRKITKADFFRSRDGHDGSKLKRDPNDPFGDIDPMWGVRK